MKAFKRLFNKDGPDSGISILPSILPTSSSSPIASPSGNAGASALPSILAASPRAAASPAQTTIGVQSLSMRVEPSATGGNSLRRSTMLAEAPLTHAAFPKAAAWSGSLPPVQPGRHPSSTGGGETTELTSFAPMAEGDYPSSSWEQPGSCRGASVVRSTRGSLDVPLEALPEVGHLADAGWTRALTVNIKSVAAAQGVLYGGGGSIPSSPHSSNLGAALVSRNSNHTSRRRSSAFGATTMGGLHSIGGGVDFGDMIGGGCSGGGGRGYVAGNSGTLVVALEEMDACDELDALPNVVPEALLKEAAKTGVSLQVDLDTEVILSGDQLGRGVSGTVFKGSYKGRQCAVKMLPPDMLFGSGSAELHTFVQEMVVLSSVRHPNIVEFLGGSLQPPNVFLIEELCAASLDAVIHGGGKGGPPARSMCAYEQLKVALDVATGLQYLHERTPAIVHRDLKPANILIDATGAAKISDFGLARVKTHAVINTKAPEVGSIGYMAPECFTSEDGALTDKCDTWSLGVVLWEMVARQRPWPRCTLPEYYREVVVRKSRLPIPQDDAVCPMALRRLISSCWSDVPDERPSCGHIVAELTRLLKYAPRPTEEC